MISQHIERITVKLLKQLFYNIIGIFFNLLCFNVALFLYFLIISFSTIFFSFYFSFLFFLFFLFFLGCPKLSTINVRACTNISDVSLSALASSCSELLKVDINGCWSVTYAGLLTVLTGCPLLTRTNLYNVF